ncbi:MAG: right-handed parallel beta-helix repeat-containing protein [Christensenellales bacterium]|jgi:parallel beta-helix repeat protein
MRIRMIDFRRALLPLLLAAALCLGLLGGCNQNSSDPQGTETATAGTKQKQITLDAGSDFAAIQEALSELPPDGILVFAAGTYTLDKPLILEKPVTIEGAGAGLTSISAADGKAVLSYSGPGKLHLKGITFSYTGTEAANVASIKNADVHVENCEFEGGVFKKEKGGGNGLEISGNSTGIILSVKSINNQNQGVDIRDDSSITVESCIITGNRSGLAFRNNSGGTVKNSEIRKNQAIGILIMNSAELSIENNTCTGNNTGMYISEDTKVEAYKNTCSNNGSIGIFVGKQAKGLLEENDCNKNSNSGIQVSGNAVITAKKNICMNNKGNGIVLLDQTEALLEDNECNENASYGIGILGDCVITARGNTCSENSITGLVASAKAQANLERNIANNNKTDGIGYLGSSTGKATENECSGNKYGIFISPGANPVLSNNNCDKNTTANIMDNR